MPISRFSCLEMDWNIKIRHICSTDIVYEHSSEICNNALHAPWPAPEDFLWLEDRHRIWLMLRVVISSELGCRERLPECLCSPRLCSAAAASNDGSEEAAPPVRRRLPRPLPRPRRGPRWRTSRGMPGISINPTNQKRRAPGFVSLPRVEMADPHLPAAWPALHILLLFMDHGHYIIKYSSPSWRSGYKTGLLIAFATEPPG